MWFTTNNNSVKGDNIVLSVYGTIEVMYTVHCNSKRRKICKKSVALNVFVVICDVSIFS